jgi:hypothetical protein
MTGAEFFRAVFHFGSGKASEVHKFLMPRDVERAN